MKLTARAEYVLRVALVLAENDYKGDLMKLNDIAEKENMSLTFLHQLIKPLKAKGLVKSVRGPNGGYCLSKDPDDIYVIEVLKCIGEDEHSVSIHAKDNATGKKIKKFYEHLNSTIRDQLEFFTIKELKEHLK